MNLKIVCLEVPAVHRDPCYKAYARACVEDSLRLKELPFINKDLASSGALDAIILAKLSELTDRAQELAQRPEQTIVYADFGVMPCMLDGIHRAEKEGRPYTYRNLPPNILAEIRVDYPVPEPPPSHPCATTSS